MTETVDVARRKSFTTSPELRDYLIGHSGPLDDVQRSLIERTRALGTVAVMQVTLEQGAFLTMLAGAVRARRAIEIGTFTGYSALCIARGMADDGLLTCCDINEQWTSIGREHWDRAGVGHKIELRLQPALDTIRAYPETPIFDFAFLDVLDVFLDEDQPGYAGYFDELVPRMLPGGLIVVDNVLFAGGVLDEDTTDDNARRIQEFNRQVAADRRMEVVMLPVSDGVTIARRRPGVE